MQERGLFYLKRVNRNDLINSLKTRIHMKAAIYHSPRKITVEQVDMPTAPTNGILIKVKSCCICGSDLHMYKLGLFSDLITRKTEQGGIPGHEYCGEVVEVGSEVKNIAVGDRVSAYSNGGMAEFVPVGPVHLGMNVFKIPEGISDNEAATLEPLANSVHAVRKGNPTQGENAVVFGVGIIGLGVIQVLKALDFGLKKIIAIDVSDKRLEMAQKVGADAVINVSRDDLDTEIRKLVDSVELSMAPGIPLPAVDIVYDCVGYIQDRPEPPVIEQAIMIARPLTGRIVAHGVFEAPVTLDFSLLVGKQIQIIGSYGGWPDDSVTSVELMQSKKVDRESLISHEFSLDQVSDAFETSCTVEDSIKVIINP
jgi:2-desacetyl-2-hydroxyethyl bacteriochlorophyllide A dehydrogenase